MARITNGGRRLHKVERKEITARSDTQRFAATVASHATDADDSARLTDAAGLEESRACVQSGCQFAIVGPRWIFTGVTGSDDLPKLSANNDESCRFFVSATVEAIRSRSAVELNERL